MDKEKQINSYSSKLYVLIDYVKNQGYKELPKTVIEYFNNLIDECDRFIEDNPNYEYTDDTFKHNLEICKESIKEVTELTCNEAQF